MNTQEAFLEAIEQDPLDPTLRLIFADWLEEQGRESEAEWFRLDVALFQEPFIDPVKLRRFYRLPQPTGAYGLRSIQDELVFQRRREESRRFWEVFGERVQ